jgi:hypothetical protein
MDPDAFHYDAEVASEGLPPLPDALGRFDNPLSVDLQSGPGTAGAGKLRVPRWAKFDSTGKTKE